MKGMKPPSPEGLALKALSNAGRRRVYETILESPGLTVTEICQATGYKQPLVSHYIEALVKADPVKRVARSAFADIFPTQGGIRQLKGYVEKAAASAARGLA